MSFRLKLIIRIISEISDENQKHKNPLHFFAPLLSLRETILWGAR